MFRYKNYKKAMAVAGSVIFLCLVSIIGVTVALFTSNVEDGSIGINATAGKVEVDIVDTTNAHETLVGEYLHFRSVDGERLAEVEFEPGASFYTEGFQIMNRGNVTLKYFLYVSRSQQVQQSDFLDAFDVYVTTDPDDPNAAIKLGSEGDLFELKKDELSDIYYLIVNMKETADNDFQDREYDGIGVTVCAMQGNIPTE